MTRQLHILVTANATWNLVNFRASILRALIADGHRITALSPPDAALPALRALGVAHEPLVMDAKSLNPVSGAGLMLRFRRAFRRLAPDVALSWTIKNNVFGALAARPLGIPFIPNVSGLGTAFLSGSMVQRVAEVLIRRAFRGLRTVFFQNDEDRALFLAHDLVASTQAHLLPGTGVDLSRFAPAPLPPADEGPVFLLIARMLRDKGVVEFAEAARILRATHPHARFHMLGPIDADNRSAIPRSMVEGWVAEGVVDYLGTTDDVRPDIARAHCVVLPSYREGAPRVLIEAAAMARPVIATDVPGCRQVVARDVTGFLCPPRDAKALAESIARFVATPRATQEAMGAAGRAKMVAEYDETLVIAAYRAAIARACPERLAA